MLQLELHERLLDIAERLRPLPSTAVQLAAAVADDDVGIDDLSQIIMQDPGLVVSLLTEANSAASSPTSQIATVRDAIIRLGIARVLALTITACLAPSSHGTVPAYGVSTEYLWAHARKCAEVADIMRRSSPHDIEPDVVTAALLHDIGKTVLGEVLEPEQLANARAHHGGLVTAERELASVDHGEVGALLLEIWNLPRSISDPVRYHHSPHEGHGLGAHVAFVADAVVHVLMETVPDVDNTELEPSLELLGIDFDKLLQTCAAKMN